MLERRRRTLDPRTLAVLALVAGLAGPAHAQDAAPGVVGTPDDEAGKRVLEQMLPESVGTPSQDQSIAPAAGDLGGGGLDAEVTGPLGRSSEAPLGPAGSMGGGGARVGESFGGGGVRVDGASAGGGGADIGRRSGASGLPGSGGGSLGN